MRNKKLFGMHNRGLSAISAIALAALIAIGISGCGEPERDPGTPIGGGFTVTFSPNTSDTVTGMPNAITNVADGATINEPAEIPQRDGYEFAGWFRTWGTDRTGTWTFGTGGDTVTANITLFAHWDARPLTVSFNPNTTDTVTDMPSQITGINRGSTIAMPAETPQRDGFRFSAWYRDSGENQTQPWTFGPGGDTVTTDITLYAKWDILGTYVVTFMPNTADTVTNMPAPITQLASGVTINLPAETPVRAGFDFMGWYKDPANTQLWIFGSGGDTITGSRNLYAGWERTLDPGEMTAAVASPGFEAGVNIGATPLTIAGREIPAGFWAELTQAATADEFRQISVRAMVPPMSNEPVLSFFFRLDNVNVRPYVTAEFMVGGVKHYQYLLPRRHTTTDGHICDGAYIANAGIGGNAILGQFHLFYIDLSQYQFGFTQNTPVTFKFGEREPHHGTATFAGWQITNKADMVRVTTTTAHTGASRPWLDGPATLDWYALNRAGFTVSPRPNGLMIEIPQLAGGSDNVDFAIQTSFITNSWSRSNNTFWVTGSAQYRIHSTTIVGAAPSTTPFDFRSTANMGDSHDRGMMAAFWGLSRSTAADNASSAWRTASETIPTELFWYPRGMADRADQIMTINVQVRASADGPTRLVVGHGGIVFGPNELESIAITGRPTNDTASIGIPLPLGVALTPANANTHTGITWTSSNEAVATINAQGLVDPLTVGTTRITATATGTPSVISDYFDLNVEAPAVVLLPGEMGDAVRTVEDAPQILIGDFALTDDRTSTGTTLILGGSTIPAGRWATINPIIPDNAAGRQFSVLANVPATSNNPVLAFWAQVFNNSSPNFNGGNNHWYLLAEYVQDGQQFFRALIPNRGSGNAQLSGTADASLVFNDYHLFYIDLAQYFDFDTPTLVTFRWGIRNHHGTTSTRHLTIAGWQLVNRADMHFVTTNAVAHWANNQPLNWYGLKIPGVDVTLAADGSEFTITIPQIAAPSNHTYFALGTAFQHPAGQGHVGAFEISGNAQFRIHMSDKVHGIRQTTPFDLVANNWSAGGNMGWFNNVDTSNWGFVQTATASPVLFTSRRDNAGGPAVVNSTRIHIWVRASADGPTTLTVRPVDRP